MFSLNLIRWARRNPPSMTIRSDLKSSSSSTYHPFLIRRFQTVSHNGMTRNSSPCWIKSRIIIKILYNISFIFLQIISDGATGEKTIYYYYFYYLKKKLIIGLNECDSEWMRKVVERPPAQVRHQKRLCQCECLDIVSMLTPLFTREKTAHIFFQNGNCDESSCRINLSLNSLSALSWCLWPSSRTQEPIQ